MIGSPGYLSPSGIAGVQSARLRGLRTVLDLQRPPVLVALRTVTNDGEIYTDPPVHCAIRFGGARPNQAGTQGAEEVETFGTVQGFAPWSIRMDQTFDLPNGQHARIVNVPPARLGVQSADFVVEG